MIEISWEMVFYYLLFFAVLVGLVVGSFLNVVIYRVPEGLSVVQPASRCPSCETPINWYDNIPVISWIILRGRCRSCGVSISVRYALVEAFVGLIAGVLWWQIASGMRSIPIEADVDLHLLGLIFALRFVFACLLVVISMVDLDHFIIPHQFTVPGMVLGLASPWILQAAFGLPDYLRIWPPVTPIMSIAGFLFGGLGVIFIFYFYLALRGVEGMGGGDVTLMAMVGAWLGPPGVVFVFFAASVQGLLAAGLTSLFGIDFVKDSRDILEDDGPPGARGARTRSEGGESDELHDAEAEDVEGDDVEGQDDEGDDVQARPAEPGEGSEADGAARDELAQVDLDSEVAHTADIDPADTDPADTDPEEGSAAVPFGPFIALAALEFLLFAPYMPEEISLTYLYALF